MNTVPAADLRPGLVVLASGEPRVVTWVGEYVSFGMPMWGWRWTPAQRQDGRYDCGYSGVRLDLAVEHQVRLAEGPGGRVEPAGAA